MAAGDALYRREIEEARAREGEYRTRLARHRTLSQKLRAHVALLHDALRDSGSGRVDQFLFEVARVSSQALEIPRASLWLFDATREHLVRRLELPVRTAAREDYRLVVAACPKYLKALGETRAFALAVSDASTDARTSELSDYLRDNAVTALLDVPLVAPGELRGVLCHEHQGGPREWQEEELDFATDVGMLVAIALEAELKKSAERQQLGTEARYRHLVESLPVAVYSFDARTGALDYLSPRVARLSGRSAEEYLVEGGVERWVSAVEPEDRELVLKRFSTHFRDDIDEEVVYRVRLPDGSRRFVRDTCSIVRDKGGFPVAFQGTLADVTAQRESELARAALETQHRTLLANVDLPAVILDAEGRVEFINDCFLTLSGYTRELSLGADGFELMLPAPERERVRAEFKKAILAGKVFRRFETKVQPRKGMERRILWTNSLLRGLDGKILGCSSLGVDVTERLEAEALALQTDKLESLGRLAAGVAHDFNNLLAVIGGAAEVLKSKIPERDAAPLGDVQLAVSQAAALTRALLAYARREPIKPSVLLADAIIESTLPILGSLMRPGLELATRLAAPEASVLIDPAQLRQVVLNLVGNAVDATLQRGSTVRVTTHVVTLEADEVQARGLSREGSFWVLTVADDGAGIAAEHLPRVFDPFFTTKQGGEGTGLGLAMCHSIVRRAGGFIVAESAPGSGAYLSVHLPLAVSSSSPP